MMEETFEELKSTMNAYPDELNKYIHQEARDKIIKMGRLDELRGVNKKLDELNEMRIEDTNEFKQLKKKTVRELKVIAKSGGLEFKYNIREDDLIKLILK